MGKLVLNAKEKLALNLFKTVYNVEIPGIAVLHQRISEL